MPKPAKGGRRHVFLQHGGASLGHATRHLTLDTVPVGMTRMLTAQAFAEAFGPDAAT